MKKGETYPPEVLTREEVLALMNACGTSRTGLRNRALITVLYRCGLRISEALDLTPKDLDVHTGFIRVLHGKGNALSGGVQALCEHPDQLAKLRRDPSLMPHAIEEILRWLDERDKLEVTPNDPLFCTLQGNRLKSAYVRKMLPRVAERARIWKRVHAHGLRHTHAYELMMEGVPVGIIQRQLGHSNMATTSRYLDHIAPAEVLDAIKKREW